MKKAILTPTRGRPDRMAQFVGSVLSTAAGDDVFCYNYIDKDDGTAPAYLDKLLSFYPKAITHIGEPQSVSKSWNVIADMALRDGAEVFIMGNDDLMYRTPRWDVILEENIKKFPDDIYCLWFEDGINGAAHCAFPIVSRKWVSTLGYFTPGIFEFGYNDTWAFDIGKRIGRAHFIPDVMTEHLHASTGKSEKDETFYRNRVTSRGSLYAIDEVTFRRTDKEREREAEKLRAVMGEKEPLRFVG